MFCSAYCMHNIGVEAMNVISSMLLMRTTIASSVSYLPEILSKPSVTAPRFSADHAMRNRRASRAHAQRVANGLMPFPIGTFPGGSKH